MNREKVIYSELKDRSKAQEAFNAGKLAGVMARYGYELTPVRNDAQGADFIAYRVGEEPLLIQLKGRPEIRADYMDKDLWMAFPTTDPDSHVMYMVPHDTLMEIWKEGNPTLTRSASWKKGKYNGTPKWLYKALADYALGED